MTPALLAALALALSGPVPWTMARLPVLRRAPRSAMILWQVVALAAVLAALGASLSLVTDQVSGVGLAPGARPGFGIGPSDGPGEGAGAGRLLVAVLALLVTLVVLGRLLLSGHRVGTRVRALRRRHRELIDLLAQDRAGVRVLDHATPMAYCLPGLGRGRVVLSAAAVRALGEDELAAVLAHERAHLRARHDLVLEAFTVLHRAFPAGVSSSAALGEVRLLVELLADGAAERSVGRRPLARALVAIADGQVPEAALGAGGSGVLIRIERLRDERSHPIQATVVCVLAAAVLLLPTVLVAVPWLRSLI